MERTNEMAQETASGETDIKLMIRSVIQEFVDVQRAKAEPAYKAELAEERKRRELLEGRLNQLVDENQRSQKRAEEAERGAAIRGELQKLGVAKVDLAFRVVKDEIVRTEEGQLVARTPQGEVAMREYLSQFVSENPELLPARIVGGSGAASSQRSPASSGIDMDKIRAGMSEAEMEQARQEIARLASQQSRSV